MIKGGFHVAFCIATLGLAGVLLAAVLESTPALVVDGDQIYENLGNGLATVGDVNGDGFADFVVGAPVKTGSEPHDHVGEVFLFLGSATAPHPSPAQILISPEVTLDISSQFGYSFGTGGDWNGDGRDDLVVGTPGYQGMGAVFVYPGVPGGFSDTPVWSAVGDVESCCGYGQSVASAGDVNGDGYDDVIVGNPYYTIGSLSFAGRAYVYLGGPSASSEPVRTYEGSFVASLLGYRIAGGGDVNADGFADILIAEPLWEHPSLRRFGRAYVYLGSASGPEAKAAWSRSAPTKDSSYAADVAFAGDVNGDGFDDILVGDSQAGVKVKTGSGQSGLNRGKAYLYLGSRSGPSQSPAWSVAGDQDDGFLGWNVASVGDVNSDGFADVMVSAINRDDIYVDQGRVYLYLGFSRGLRTNPAWFLDGDIEGAGGAGGIVPASAGDVNGDGLGDVLLGFPGYNTGADQISAGRAMLFLAESDPDGAPDGGGVRFISPR